MSMNKDWGKDPLGKGAKLLGGFPYGEWPRSTTPKPTAFCCSATPCLGEAGLGSAGLVPVVGPHSRDLFPSLLPKVNPKTMGRNGSRKVQVREASLPGLSGLCRTGLTWVLTWK